MACTNAVCRNTAGLREICGSRSGLLEYDPVSLGHLLPTYL
jgi:hypothetical protein